MHVDVHSLRPHPQCMAISLCMGVSHHITHVDDVLCRMRHTNMHKDIRNIWVNFYMISRFCLGFQDFVHDFICDFLISLMISDFSCDFWFHLWFLILTVISDFIMILSNGVRDLTRVGPLGYMCYLGSSQLDLLGSCPDGRRGTGPYTSNWRHDGIA